MGKEHAIFVIPPENMSLNEPTIATVQTVQADNGTGSSLPWYIFLAAELVLELRVTCIRHRGLYCV